MESWSENYEDRLVTISPICYSVHGVEFDGPYGNVLSGRNGRFNTFYWPIRKSKVSSFVCLNLDWHARNGHRATPVQPYITGYNSQVCKSVCYETSYLRKRSALSHLVDETGLIYYVRNPADGAI